MEQGEENMVDIFLYSSLASIVFTGSAKKCEVWHSHAGTPSDLPIPDVFLEFLASIYLINSCRLMY